MSTVLTIVIAGVTALFLTIPMLNSRVFHSVNVSDVIEQGREGLSSMMGDMGRANYQAVRDTAQSLTERFRSDSSYFFLADVQNWDKAQALVREGKDEFATNVLLSSLLKDADSIGVKLEKDSTGADIKRPPLSRGLRLRFVAALNAMVADPAFYTSNAQYIDVERDRGCKNRLTRLGESGIILGEKGNYRLTTLLTPQILTQLRSFHVEILARILYPQFLSKDRKRNTDWASEFIDQTAMYYYGESYRVERKPEEAIRAFDSMLVVFPKALQAERIFLEIGQILYEDGLGRIRANDPTTGIEKLHRAIRYLERIEKNREVARDFPKYKQVELNPGTYVNLDEASKAKRKIRQNTVLYTQAQAKAEESKEKGADEGGNTLEDAVKLIGECYVLMGESDSARQQLGLLVQFFPESDNLDDAQKLVADSYVKDGDRIILADSAGAEARESANQAYAKAVKQYLKFINVYPQSDLISQTYISLADTYMKMGKPEDGARAFASALDLAKETSDKAKVQLQIGNYYFDGKKFKQAVDAYQVILTSFSSVEDVAAKAQYLIGGCYEAMGDTAAGIKAYESVVSYYKTSEFFAISTIKVGKWNFQNGNYKDALKYFNNGYSYRPDGEQAAQCVFETGVVWKKMAEDAKDKESQNQDYAEAIKQFSKVVELFQDEPGQETYVDQSSYQLAQCYMKTDKEDAARKATKTIKNRAMAVQAIKIIGIDIESPEKELEYWEKLFQEALDDEERAAILNDKAAIFLEKTNDYQAALVAYQKMLDLTKDESRRISARIGIARVYSAQKKYPEAAAAFSEVLGNQRISKEMRQQIQVQLYDALFNAKEYAKALEGFESFAATYADHNLAPYAIYRAGLIYAQQGKNKEALQRMDTVVHKYKTSDQYEVAVLGVGDQMIALGQAAEGVAYLEKFLKSRPIDSIESAPNVYLRLGETYKTKLNDKAKALKCFQTIHEKYPDHYLYSYASYQYGMGLKDEGKEKEAVEVFDKVKRQDKAVYRAAQAEIGKIMAATDPEAAVRNYDKIVQESETPEDSATAMIGIGDVYVTVKKWDQAAASFEKVYAFYHGADTNLIAGAIAKWVDALNSDKQYDSAIKAAQIMQEKYPANQFTVNAMYFEATAWFAKKNYASARKKFLEIIEGNTSEQMTEIAYFQKGDCYYFSNKFADAVKEYETYLKKYPEGKYRSSALYMQGNACWQLQDFKNAKDKFQAVVSGYPEFPDICNAKNFLAYSLNKVDKWKEASKLYTEVLNSGSCSGSPQEFARKQKEAIGTQH